MQKTEYKKIIKNIFGIGIFVVFLYFLSSIDKEAVEQLAQSLGFLGVVIIGFLLVITQVFAPLSGSAFFFMGIRLYGYESILVLFYCTSMISAIIAFFIARKWGRNLVVKFVGKKHMDRVDEVIVLHENKLLIVGRTLGYYFFDFISYALGLTTVSFKKYISYTAGLTAIPMIFLYVFFRDLDFDKFSHILFLYGSVVIVGIVFVYLFMRIIEKERNLNKNNTF